MKHERTILVFEVLYDTGNDGSMGDGLAVYRTRDQATAERFAKSHTCYGNPCAVHGSPAPLRIARRWGLA